MKVARLVAVAVAVSAVVAVAVLSFRSDDQDVTAADDDAALGRYDRPTRLTPDEFVVAAGDVVTFTAPISVGPNCLPEFVAYVRESAEQIELWVGHVPVDLNPTSEENFCMAAGVMGPGDFVVELDSPVDGRALIDAPDDTEVRLIDKRTLPDAPDGFTQTPIVFPCEEMHGIEDCS